MIGVGPGSPANKGRLRASRSLGVEDECLKGGRARRSGGRDGAIEIEVPKLPTVNGPSRATTGVTFRSQPRNSGTWDRCVPTSRNAAAAGKAFSFDPFNSIIQTNRETVSFN